MFRRKKTTPIEEDPITIPRKAIDELLLAEQITDLLDTIAMLHVLNLQQKKDSLMGVYALLKYVEQQAKGEAVEDPNLWRSGRVVPSPSKLLKRKSTRHTDS